MSVEKAVMHMCIAEISRRLRLGAGAASPGHAEAEP